MMFIVANQVCNDPTRLADCSLDNDFAIVNVAWLMMNPLIHGIDRLQAVHIIDGCIMSFIILYNIKKTKLSPQACRNRSYCNSDVRINPSVCSPCWLFLFLPEHRLLMTVVPIPTQGAHPTRIRS